jgi:cytochrome c peroxidase
MKTFKSKTFFTATLLYGLGLPLSAWATLTPPQPINTENNIPLDTAGNGIIKDKGWAIVLGKALFWDIQAGSDNQACASCHFSAGADSRIRNQWSPGFNQKPTEDKTFGSITSFDGEAIPGAVAGKTLSQIESGNTSVLDATYSLQEGDFPLHHIADYKDRNSDILFSTNDVVSSNGAYDAVFGKIKKKTETEKCKKPDANVFKAGKYAARQVEPRNTPTTINAVFNFANFWDGRANNLFNGVDAFGPRTLHSSGDPNKRLVIVDDNGNAALGAVSVKNASLASQAVAPPLSQLEMSCNGKTFPDFGKKMLSTSIIPLQLQAIADDDSVFSNSPDGDLIDSSGKGLNKSYAELIQLAFEDKYWQGEQGYKISSGQLQTDKKVDKKGYYSQMAINFSLFWGLAIQMYEATLVSDQSPFDTWFAACRPVVSNPTSLFGNVNKMPIDNPTVRCRQPNSTNVARFSEADTADTNGDGIPDVLDTNSNGVVDIDLNGDNLTNAADIPFAPAAAAALPVVDPLSFSVPGFGAQEIRGFGVFNNGGVGIRDAGSPACSGCHPVTGTNVANPASLTFPVFSEAQFQNGQTFVPVERSRIDDRGPGTPGNPPVLGTPLSSTAASIEGAVHDRGFFNIGVMPTAFDLGNGGTDPYGQPLSLARMFLAEEAGEAVTNPSGVLTSTGVQTNRCSTATLVEAGGTPRFPGCTDNIGPPNPLLLDKSQERELVDGTFKTPHLRGVALTPPYFHNGAYSTLRQVVEFYARGGSRRDKSLVSAGNTGDTSGTGSLGKSTIPVAESDYGTNVDFFIRDVKSTDEPDGQIDAMVAFMKALTDERTRCDAGPFDHPELPVSNGHTASDSDKNKKADDIIATIPAVGAGGYAAAGKPELCLPNDGNLFNDDLRNRLIE